MSKNRNEIANTMNRLLYTLLIILISNLSTAASGTNDSPVTSKSFISQSPKIEEAVVKVPSMKLAPKTTPRKKRDGVAGLVIIGLIFFWFGLSLIILAGILALLLLGGLVWFLIGLLFFLLGIIFWSIARQKRRKNKRERRKKKKANET